MNKLFWFKKIIPLKISSLYANVRKGHCQVWKFWCPFGQAGVSFSSWVGLKYFLVILLNMIRRPDPMNYKNSALNIQYGNREKLTGVCLNNSKNLIESKIQIYIMEQLFFYLGSWRWFPKEPSCRLFKFVIKSDYL